jgi:Protein of unknown function (DUF2971)
MTTDQEPLSVAQACRELKLRTSAHRVEGDGTLDDQPEVLYHYTSLESACKILGSGRLWASRVYFLNDASEVEYGAKIVSECIDSCSGIPEELRQLFRPGPHGERSGFMRVATTWPTHVFCLSRQADSLGQWRAYGRSGASVAIGFKKTRLHEIRAATLPHSPFRIIYIKEEQLKALDGPMSIVRDISGRISADRSDWNEFWLTVLSELALFAFRFKNPAFREEEEWRLFWLSNNPPAQFRLASDSQILVPYIEAEFGPEAVCKIVQGPLARPEVGEISLKEFLKRKRL